MRNYEDLEVWQKSHSLTVRIYRTTESFPRSELFGLTSQIRRSAGSIGANLAEGCGRWSDAELARFVQIAMGSASELQNHLLLAKDLGFLTSADYANLLKSLQSIRKMMTALLQALRGKRNVQSDASGQERRAKGE